MNDTGAAARHKAWRQKQKNRRIVRDGRLWQPHPSCPHGTTRGYNDYSCRCWPCTDARSAYDEVRDR